MQLKDFILKLNTYGPVDHNFPIDRLIYYDLNHNEHEIFSCNFCLQPFTCNSILFDVDNYYNLVLTNAEYNNDLYLIVGIDEDHYAYYQFMHMGFMFVVFKIYPPGVQYVYDEGRNVHFKYDCDEYFSTALCAIRLPCFDLLSPNFFEGPKTPSIENVELNRISKNLFLAIEKLNSLVEPYKLLYTIR